MRLIDADALNLDYEVDMADDWKTAHEIANVVKYAPTIDAVPREKYDRLKENAEILSKACDEMEYVVRCKGCKHRDPEDHKCDCGHDILWQLPRADEWFCADGERGEQDDSF